MMMGAITENGIRKIAANSGTQVSTTISPAMLPRYMLAIRPQTKSFSSTNSRGPGCRPQIISPPSSTRAGAVAEMAGLGAHADLAAAAKALGLYHQMRAEHDLAVRYLAVAADAEKS